MHAVTTMFEANSSTLEPLPSYTPLKAFGETSISIVSLPGHVPCPWIFGLLRREISSLLEDRFNPVKPLKQEDTSRYTCREHFRTTVCATPLRIYCAHALCLLFQPASCVSSNRPGMYTREAEGR